MQKQTSSHLTIRKETDSRDEDEDADEQEASHSQNDLKQS
jgi:hypothetical protein